MYGACYPIDIPFLVKKLWRLLETLDLRTNIFKKGLPGTRLGILLITKLVILIYQGTWLFIWKSIIVVFMVALSLYYASRQSIIALFLLYFFVGVSLSCMVMKGIYPTKNAPHLHLASGLCITTCNSGGADTSENGTLVDGFQVWNLTSEPYLHWQCKVICKMVYSPVHIFSAKGYFILPEHSFWQ